MTSGPLSGEGIQGIDDKKHVNEEFLTRQLARELRDPGYNNIRPRLVELPGAKWVSVLSTLLAVGGVEPDVEPPPILVG
jgi:hypothetical protein